jgi:hypothetical protein
MQTAVDFHMAACHMRVTGAAGLIGEPAMSTRALYTFKGENAANTWNVYKHHDGYPTGAAEVLLDTVAHYAWPSPRYEADEFAASFIAAAKSDHFLRALTADTAEERANALRYAPKGGGVRMMPQGKPMSVALKHCSDIDYRYEIYRDAKQQLCIAAYAVSAWEAPGSEMLLTDCLLVDFAYWANKDEEVA